MAINVRRGIKRYGLEKSSTLSVRDALNSLFFDWR